MSMYLYPISPLTLLLVLCWFISNFLFVLFSHYLCSFLLFLCFFFQFDLISFLLLFERRRWRRRRKKGGEVVSLLCFARLSWSMIQFSTGKLELYIDVLFRHFVFDLCCCCCCWFCRRWMTSQGRWLLSGNSFESATVSQNEPPPASSLFSLLAEEEASCWATTFGARLAFAEMANIWAFSCSWNGQFWWTLWRHRLKDDQWTPFTKIFSYRTRLESTIKRIS